MNNMVESAELRLRTIEGARMSFCFSLLWPIHLSRPLDSAAQYAPGLMEGIANIMQRLGAIDDRLGAINDRLDTIEGRLGTIEDDTLLNNAMTLNHRTIARNQMNQPHCEPLRKTVHFI